MRRTDGAGLRWGFRGEKVQKGDERLVVKMRFIDRRNRMGRDQESMTE